MDKYVIDMRGVSKSYGKGESAVRALTDVTFTVEHGEFAAILGPSGSGKTTLMNLIGLMDTSDCGEYYLDGLDISRAKERTFARLRNEKIGFVFQKFNLITKYNALYNVALPLLLNGYTYRNAKRKATETLERVGLGDRLKHKPTELSGGQLQRVAIARALVNDCSLILADEPTGALDQKTGVDVLNFMRELNATGKTIVMITHDTKIASMARRIIKVEDGRLLDTVPV
ncbi:MAG: ABC transporter ATP-binding protein [Oscillospiraceae bacterium]|nr:ABC transporter ATP-binding protein [Oscillospiraceae bacterium]